MYFKKMTASTTFVFQLFLVLCLIMLIVLPSSLSKVSGNRSRKTYYGSPCNSSVKCDIHSLLMCEDHTCQCLYPDAMTYNTELGTCVSLVNEICGYVETKRVFINCVPNAFCDQQQGVCKCTHGFIEKERQCKRQKSYGESCHSDSECLSELSLTCFEETCQCDSKRYLAYTINPHLNSPSADNSQQAVTTLKRTATTKCVAIAGSPCTAKTGCVNKASCVVTDTENYEILVTSSLFSWMHQGTCKCDKGYEEESGRCLGKHESQCDVLANISCSNQFNCVDGICQCKYPDDQIYDKETGKCVSLAGGPCTNPTSNENENEEDGKDEENKCDKFMECKNLSCKCKHGFVENFKRGCAITYGHLCTGETMNKCDEAAGLHCVEGKCTCKDLRKEYNLKIGKCVGKLGSSCKIATTLPTSSDIGSENRREDGEALAEPIRDGMQPCSGKAKCRASRTQLDGLVSQGFCLLPTGGRHVPSLVMLHEESFLNSVSHQESVSEEDMD